MAAIFAESRFEKLAGSSCAGFVLNTATTVTTRGITEVYTITDGGNNTRSITDVVTWNTRRVRARPRSPRFSHAVRGLNRMKNLRRRLRNRAGFTMAELMIVVVLIVSLVARSRRSSFAAALSSRRRQRHRRASAHERRCHILRPICEAFRRSAKDILAMSLTSMQFRAFVGTSVLCDSRRPAHRHSAEVARVGNVLTAWINPPAANDVAFIYDEGPLAGNAETLATVLDYGCRSAVNADVVSRDNRNSQQPATPVPLATR